MAKLDARIRYWTRDERDKNFGDFLTEFIALRALGTPLIQADIYRLIGSAISEDIIAQDLQTLPVPEHGLIAFWGCGMRDGQSTIPQQLLENCRFFGIRGPLSRDALGLPDNTPLGDPGLLLPLIHRPSKASTEGKTICVPHVMQPDEAAAFARTGADLLVSPYVSTIEDLTRLIDSVVSADFVLTGALHVAIVAAAYGRPFAFWNPGFLDIPFKWADFAASLGIEARFVTTVEEGRAEFARNANLIKLPSLSGMLGCCPLSVRPSIMIDALTRDLSLGGEEINILRQKSATLWLDQAGVIEQMRQIENDTQTRRHRAALDQMRSDRSMARSELAQVQQGLAIMAERMERRSRVYGLTLNAKTPQIAFGEKDLGSFLLEGSWTPANEIGPWTLPGLSSIRLPAGTGWEEASAVALEGYLFAPKIGEGPGSRWVKIWMNGTLVCEQVFENMTNGPTFWTVIRASIPEALRLAGVDIVMSLGIETALSPHELGVGEDARPIGFSLASMKFDYSYDETSNVM